LRLLLVLLLLRPLAGRQPCPPFTRLLGLLQLLLLVLLVLLPQAQLAFVLSHELVKLFWGAIGKLMHAEQFCAELQRWHLLSVLAGSLQYHQQPQQ
jgi:hypothetical protein